MTECWVHKHRDEVPIDVHHIWPLGDGGPDIEDNLISLCPNGHRRVHSYLRLLKKYGPGKVPWLKRRLFGAKVRYVAISGYDAMNAAASWKLTEGDPQ